MSAPDSVPLVSVIIPTFNAEPYIEQTIASVKAQSHERVEIIVVDDGSSDRTRDLVHGFGASVKLLDQPNQGVCRARNRGFSVSQGEFVCFLDHDDYWFPWKLRRQIETFRRYPNVGVVCSNFFRWEARDDAFPEPESLGVGADLGIAEVAQYSGWIYHELLLDCRALTSTAMIRREVFAAFGGFDESLPYSEEWDLWLRISREWQFVRLQGVSTLYRQHRRQGSRVSREVDYRTSLLHRARARWGLQSPDGRGISAAEFDRNVARYHMEFGLEQLCDGSRRLALASLGRACASDPRRAHYWALLCAAALGWRPRRIVRPDA